MCQVWVGGITDPTDCRKQVVPPLSDLVGLPLRCVWEEASGLALGGRNAFPACASLGAMWQRVISWECSLLGSPLHSPSTEPGAATREALALLLRGPGSQARAS